MKTTIAWAAALLVLAMWLAHNADTDYQQAKFDRCIHSRCI